MCDGTAEVMLLFEMVGAVLLGRNGAAHEAWEGDGKSVITGVPEPALGSDRDQGLASPPSGGPLHGDRVVAQDPASKRHI